jgi:hypothetical protein
MQSYIFLDVYNGAVLLFREAIGTEGSYVIVYPSGIRVSVPVALANQLPEASLPEWVNIAAEAYAVGCRSVYWVE